MRWLKDVDGFINFDLVDAFSVEEEEDGVYMAAAYFNDRHSTFGPKFSEYDEAIEWLLHTIPMIIGSFNHGELVVDVNDPGFGQWTK